MFLIFGYYLGPCTSKIYDMTIMAQLRYVGLIKPVMKTHFG